MLSLPGRIVLERDYGPLRKGLDIHLDRGYSALVGENNSGKSALLQYLFIESLRHAPTPTEHVAMLLPNRAILPERITPLDTLHNWNQQFYQRHEVQPRQFGGDNTPDPSQLHALLLHGDLLAQMQEFKTIIRELGFGDTKVVQSQSQTVDGRPAPQHGSGLRAIFPIVAAITNPDVKMVLIDEPEFALEARVQKRLRELFLEKTSEGKDIVVATHSHLFVNRVSIDHNYEVKRASDGLPSVKRLSEPGDMLDISSNLLGNSPSDLFFPDNFLIVEGASDQVISDRVRELCGISQLRVKILAASSLERVGRLEEAITTALIPLVADYSPYHRKVVCLIDSPNRYNEQITNRLERVLGERLLKLEATSLEDYLAPELYALAGLDRVKLLEDLRLAKRVGNHREEMQIKRQISSGIAAILSVEHLHFLPIIVQAVKKAAGVMTA